MPTVSEGITIAGEPASSGAADPFAADVRAGSLPAKPDPALSSAEEIRAAVQSSEGSTDLRDGIEIAPEREPTPEPREPISPELQKILDQGKLDLEKDAREREAGAEAIELLARQELYAAVEAASDPSEIVAPLAKYRDVAGEDNYLEQVDEIAGWWLDADPDSEDEEESEAWGRLADALTKDSETIAALRDAVEKTQLAESLIPAAAAQRAEETAKVIQDWQQELGLSGEEARARIVQLEQLVREDYPGRELADFAAHDPEGFRALLRSEDASDKAVTKEFGDTAFKQELLEAPSTSVAEGFTQMTPWGPMSTNPKPQLTPDQARIDARAVATAHRRPDSADSIRKGVAEPESTDWRESLTTADGKPTTFDKASGNLERAKREREEAIARDRGLLKG